MKKELASIAKTLGMSSSKLVQNILANALTQIQREIESKRKK